MLAGACDDADRDGPPPAPGQTACGSGQAALIVGDGDPFMPSPEQTYLIEAGRQGGFHTSVSLRAQGALDADLVDIEIQLRDGERLIAQHVTTEWYLVVNRAGPSCDYLRARLILAEDGQLLTLEDALALDGRPLTLTARMTSSKGVAEAEQEIRLDASDL